MMKRLFALLFAVVFTTISVSPAMVANANSLSTDRIALSNMTTDQKIQFLQTQGVEIPDGYSEYIVSLIARVEDNPNHPIAISNPVTYEIALQVKNAVNNYYERDNNQISRAATAYTLQDSTVYGD